MVTVLMVLTLSSGLGVNVAIYSVARRAVLRSLPVDDTDRFVFLYGRQKNEGAYGRRSLTGKEIAAFAEAGEMSREIAERAFSNEVVTPGVTTLEDVAWWMSDQQLARGLESSFDMPSVYVTGPEGIVATSTDRIIQRGDLIINELEANWMGYRSQAVQPVFVEVADPVHLELIKVQREVFETIRPMLRPGVTVKELAEILAKALGSNVQPEFSGKPTLVSRRKADLTKISTLLGYQPKMEVQQGLTEVARAIAAQPDLY